MNQANAAIQGKHAVMSILDLIERVPDIDIASSKGKQPKNVCGAIAVKNISFTYQNRPESKVLDQFSLNAEVDQRIAIVGRTGSGLVMFHNPFHMQKAHCFMNAENPLLLHSCNDFTIRMLVSFRWIKWTCVTGIWNIFGVTLLV